MCDKSVTNIEQIDTIVENNDSEFETIIANYIECNDNIEQYDILTQQEVSVMMNRMITDVTDVIKLTGNAVRVLLNKYNWDKQKLYDDYYDERKRTYDYYGVKFLKLNIDKQPNGRNEMESYCLICFSEESQTHMSSMLCGHQFCIECVRQYVTTKINESIADGIVCPLFDECGCYVDDKLIDLVITQPLSLKYQKLILNSFVSNNKSLRWCAYPDCPYVVEVNRIQFQSITCKCGHKFCFECSEISHEPIRCDLLKMWHTMTSEKSDYETAKWIHSNTKKCPNCKSRIEKNGGCEHMECSNCNHEFCWLCFMDWTTHTDCIIRSSNGQTIDDWAPNDDYRSVKDTQLINALDERVVEYWTQFKNQQNKLNDEKIMCNELSKQLDEPMIKGLTFVDKNLVIRASEVLCNCRQTLMFSYPFAFYVFDNNQSQIFKYNQSNLESNTEKLSHHLDSIRNDINNLKVLGANILDETNYCEIRCRVLINHVNEGYDKDFWHFYSFD